MSEMKLCPFCGSKALTNIFLDYEDIENLPTNVIDDYEPEVTCENERCIYGWWLSPKDWNTRPIEDALHARIAELEAECEQLRRGIHDETVPEKYEENVAKLQKEFSMRFENESPVEFYRTIRSGQYPQPPEVQGW